MTYAKDAVPPFYHGTRADLEPGDAHGFDPTDFYQPGEIARLLDDDWKILVDGSRPRTAAAPAGTSHVRDVVLRAQRLR